MERVRMGSLRILLIHSVCDPGMWSVVPLTTNFKQPPESWGATYGVCPSCSARAALGQPPVHLVCPRCNGLFAVAWEDSGLCVFEAREARDAGDRATS